MKIVLCKCSNIEWTYSTNDGNVGIQQFAKNIYIYKQNLNFSRGYLVYDIYSNKYLY